jgi:hypothetical protein
LLFAATKGLEYGYSHVQEFVDHGWGGAGREPHLLVDGDRLWVLDPLVPENVMEFHFDAICQPHQEAGLSG